MTEGYPFCRAGDEANESEVRLFGCKLHPPLARVEDALLFGTLKYNEEYNMKSKLKARERIANISGRPVPNKKKVVVDIPYALYKEAAEAVQTMHTTISGFVRQSVERYLEDLRRAKLEQELEVGYLANTAATRKINDEFCFADAEIS